MRNRKTILLLLIALIAVSAADFSLYFTKRPPKSGERASLVELSGAVARLAVARKGCPETVLERNDGRWRLSAPFSGSANEEVVMRLLDALSLTPVSDVITDSELLKLGRVRADFALDDPPLQVALTLEDGLTHRVAFGAPTPAADEVYAAVGETAALFVVPQSVFAAADVSADGFRRRSLFLLDSRDVTSFDIKAGTGGLLEFSRTGDAWNLRDSRTSTAKVSTFLSDLLAQNAESFVWPVGGSNETERATSALLAGYGLEPDSAVTVTLKGADGRDRQVSFGKAAGEGLVYALVQNGGAIVTVAASLRETASRAASLFTDSRLFPVEARSVVSFSIVDADVPYVLSRDMGGVWGLESPIAAPAEQSVVETVLSRLLALTTADRVSENGVSVSISTNDEQAVVARERVLGEHSFEDFRSREMLRVDPALVKRVVRTESGEGAKPVSVVFARDLRTWSVENGDSASVADEKGIASVLAAVNPLTAVRVVRLKVPASDLDDFGLDVPFLTVAVDRESDETVRRNILVGKKTKGGRFATIGSSDAVFVISESAVRSLSSKLVGK